MLQASTPYINQTYGFKAGAEAHQAMLVSPYDQSAFTARAWGAGQFTGRNPWNTLK